MSCDHLSDGNPSWPSSCHNRRTCRLLSGKRWESQVSRLKESGRPSKGQVWVGEGQLHVGSKKVWVTLEQFDIFPAVGFDFVHEKPAGKVTNGNHMSSVLCNAEVMSWVSGHLDCDHVTARCNGQNFGNWLCVHFFSAVLTLNIEQMVVRWGLPVPFLSGLPPK